MCKRVMPLQQRIKEGLMIRKLIIIVTAMMGILILGVLPALAITYGEADGEGHPNVGVLVYQDGGDKVGLCSGTLIASDVFLTAGHCTAYLLSLGITDVWVSFDPVFDPGSSTLISGTYHTNSAYYIPSTAAQSDLAVVILDEEVTWIAPASLPRLGLLDQIGKRNSRDQEFTTVGYGDIQPSIGHGPPTFNDFGTRRVATSTFNALNKNWLRLSGNNATDNGGTCYGDSGGPNFLGAGSNETNIIAGITVTAMCLATNVDLRLDTVSARSFLGQYVLLP
jgi:hypothetical protein